ncbi:MAG: winged helix family two component response transcriptional regulator [Anaerolineaceae bacterium]|nr:MAG: winged helix family two component response transcriptional regulator [Anaerolineaceae bacterium]
MSPTPPGPYLTDPQKHEHILPPESAVIGRAVECDVVIASARVSREHARLRREGRKWFLEDLGSTNGTFLNDERIPRPMELRDGDQISIGEVIFTFHDPDTTTRENPVPDLEVDAAAGVVRVNRRAVTLSPKEYALLAYLHNRRGQVCSKDEIGRAVWPEYEAGGIFDYQIENLVRRLRTRIETDPANPQLLLTVRGLGYKLVGG